MTYEEYLRRDTFSKEELIADSQGRLVEDVEYGSIGFLPAPPFLMFDRITAIDRGRPGRIVGEQDIHLDAWYFQCHFTGDPVQPGCLGLDAVWQLLGFYLSVCGARGVGRALGCKEVDFLGQIRPHSKLVVYDVEVSRVMWLKESGSAIVVGDAIVSVDSEEIYIVKGGKVGFFRGIRYPDYPFPSKNAFGGVIRSGSEEVDK